MKYRVTRTPLTTRGELVCSGRVSSSCSTNDTRRVNLVGRVCRCQRGNQNVYIEDNTMAKWQTTIYKTYTDWIDIINRGGILQWFYFILVREMVNVMRKHIILKTLLLEALIKTMLTQYIIYGTLLLGQLCKDVERVILV
jgi:hypothetical protein